MKNYKKTDAVIEELTDPKLKTVLKTMITEYRGATSLQSVVAYNFIIVFWVVLVGALLFVAFRGSAYIFTWFSSLSNGFTKSEVIALIIAFIGLLGIPAAYGYGRKKPK